MKIILKSLMIAIALCGWSVSAQQAIEASVEGQSAALAKQCIDTIESFDNKIAQSSTMQTVIDVLKKTKKFFKTGVCQKVFKQNQEAISREFYQRLLIQVNETEEAIKLCSSLVDDKVREGDLEKSAAVKKCKSRVVEYKKEWDALFACYKVNNEFISVMKSKGVSQTEKIEAYQLMGDRIVYNSCSIAMKSNVKDAYYPAMIGYIVSFQIDEAHVICEKMKDKKIINPVTGKLIQNCDKEEMKALYYSVHACGPSAIAPAPWCNMKKK
jgi:hypothetical protein